MTDTKSLSERLRSASGDTLSMREFRIMVEQRREAADVIDRQAAEIARLKQIIQDLHYEMRDEAARNE